MRRHLSLRIALFVLLAGCAGVRGAIELDKPTPPPSPFALPAEFEPVDRVLIGFEQGNWDYLPYFTELAEDVAQHADVVVVGDEIDRSAFAEHLVSVGVRPERIQQVEAPLDSMWIRDYGPMFVRTHDGTLAVVDLPYHDDRVADDELPGRIASLERRLHVRVKLPLEGGHIQSDGSGRCVVTDQVMHLAQLDLGLGPNDVADELYALFGCEETTWVPAMAGEETGHLDVFALVTGPGRILVGRYERAQDPLNARLLDEAAETLANAGFVVTRIPMPSNGHQRIFRTYTNALILDDAVLVPVFGGHAYREREALDVLAEAFPTRRIVPIDASGVMELAGAVHCTTRAVPRE
ncbi:MAG: agmatine deiminase family protein [Myxococcales bacterium]|nr:agmatine deiminase family protein [Myxococcales bacterium]